jgi:hypothetical protein
MTLAMAWLPVLSQRTLDKALYVANNMRAGTVWSAFELIFLYEFFYILG